MKQPEKLLFLPGAAGNPVFWQPVADRICGSAQQRLLGWPGFGNVPPHPDVNSFDDLIQLVLTEIDCLSALIAQSMGGAIALRAAIEQTEQITHLVLTATSGGINMSDTNAVDWRPAFFAANPTAPRWFESYQEDISSKIRDLTIPTLLLWGDCDPISPVSVGKKLKSLFNNASLHVLLGGEHDLAHRHPVQIASLIVTHLGSGFSLQHCGLG